MQQLAAVDSSILWLYICTNKAHDIQINHTHPASTCSTRMAWYGRTWIFTLNWIRWEQMLFSSFFIFFCLFDIFVWMSLQHLFIRRYSNICYRHHLCIVVLLFVWNWSFRMRKQKSASDRFVFADAWRDFGSISSRKRVCVAQIATTRNRLLERDG